MNGGDKGTRILGIASSDAKPSFEVQERVFPQVTQFVKVPIIGALRFAVLLWRNDGLIIDSAGTKVVEYGYDALCLWP